MISVLHIASRYLKALEADDVGKDTLVKSFIKAYMNHAKTDVPSNLVSILNKIHTGDKKNPALKGTDDFPGIDKAVADAFAAVKGIEYDSKFLNRYHFGSNEELRAVIVLESFLDAFHSDLAYKIKGPLSTSIPTLENLFKQINLIGSRIPIGEQVRYQKGVKKAEGVFKSVPIPEHYSKGYKPPEEKPAEKSKPKVQIPLDLKKKPGAPPTKPSPKPGVTVPLKLKVPPGTKRAPGKAPVPLKPTPQRPIPAPAPTPQAKPPKGPGVRTVPLKGIKPAPKAPEKPKTTVPLNLPKPPAKPAAPKAPVKKAPAAPVKKAPTKKAPAAPIKKTPTKKAPVEPEELSNSEKERMYESFKKLRAMPKPAMDRFKAELKEMEVGQALKKLPWGSDDLTIKDVLDALKRTKDRDKALDEFKDFLFFELNLKA